MKIIMNKVKHIIQTEAVLLSSVVAALVTMFFVPPSVNYNSYLNYRVLALLFCLMAVVSGFQKTGIFLLLSDRLSGRVKTLRALTLILVLLCFLTSMLVTNDVALITFVPFALHLLTVTKQQKYIIRVIVLQTIAANLGSMLTPIGNPQNLYLYTRFDIPILTFVKIMFPYTIVSLVLLCLIILITKKESLSFERSDRMEDFRKNSGLLSVYLVLFGVCLACVLRFLDYRIMLLVVLLTVLIFDKHRFKRIDYALLLTFVCFFVFVGNMERIPVIKEFLSGLLAGRELPIAILASQIISNVPAAVLLSAFTDHYKALLLGTDIGGLGTLIASLASLISYKFYCRTQEVKRGKYLLVFTLYNLLFLAILCMFYYVIQ